MATTINPISVPSAESAKKVEVEEGYSGIFCNTVNPYHRHMFLVHKNVENWAPNNEKADKDSLPGILAAALKSHAHKTPIKTRLTICGAPFGTDSSDGDVFVFPEMVRYRGLTNNDADKFAEDVLVNGKVSGPVNQLEGSYVFVCSYGGRDKRCGVVGPKVIDRFKEEIKLREMQDRVFVGPCSHVGGVKFTENLMIFNRKLTGEVTGDWYGSANPEDVPAMLDQHIGKGDVIKSIWRGRMLAFPTDDSQKVVEQKPLETVLEKGEKEESQARTKAVDMVKDAGSFCQYPGWFRFSELRDGTAEAPKTKPIENVGTTFTGGSVLEKGEKEVSQASTEAGDLVKDAGSCRDESGEDTKKFKKHKINYRS